VYECGGEIGFVEKFSTQMLTIIVRLKSHRELAISEKQIVNGFNHNFHDQKLKRPQRGNRGFIKPTNPQIKNLSRETPVHPKDYGEVDTRSTWQARILKTYAIVPGQC
jgi:hypothetical protein